MSGIEHEAGQARDKKKRSRQRVFAFLAGGLVLGIGTATTLAVWNDSEFATGTFEAGAFNLEGTTDDATWSQHASAGTAAALTFTVDPTNLSPGDVVYAPFAVRLDDTTTTGASVAISVDGTTGVVTGLTYELIQPTVWGCGPTTTGTTMVQAGTAMTGVGAGPAAFTLAGGTPPSTPGAPAYMCFKVTADTGLAQSQTGTVTWEFAATSS